MILFEETIRSGESFKGPKINVQVQTRVRTKDLEIKGSSHLKYYFGKMDLYCLKYKSDQS